MMHGSSRSVGSPARPLSEMPGASEGYDGLVRRVSAEFGGPAGLLDPRRGTWLAQAGAPVSAFPRLGPGLVAASAAEGRPTVWRGEEEAGRIWLLLPITEPEGAFVAAAVFAATARAADSAEFPLGPFCPEPALRAWAQSFADSLHEPAKTPEPQSTSQLRSAVSSSVRASTPSRSRPPRPSSEKSPPAAPPKSVEGGDRQIVARLIRRLKISDPPVRFQQMATNALKAALGVQAVAWVPCHHAEPVVAAGEVGRLKGNGFRTLLPGPQGKGSLQIDNRPDAPSDPAVSRTMAVGADAQASVGWLIVINPLEDRDFVSADADQLYPVASLIASQQGNARVYADLKELLFGVIRALTSAIDAKDPYTSGHSERVARIAVRLAEELGMTPNQRGDLYLMGLLHDVGKIGVDDAVLKKPGPLTPDEYRQIQAHVEIGVHILTDLKKLSHLLPGVRHHHESLDGTGYPCGLAGEAIPFEARILAVADSFDAMSSTRPYRRRLTPSQINEILRKGSSVQWDPRIIDALFACRMDLELIRQKGLGESLQLAVSDTLGRS